jgi:pyrimidine deaminase RibD-like protein
MESDDIKFMKEAIKWSNGCQPVKESIPKVGAIIAVGKEAIGRGRRGTGQEGDDEHAEWNALQQVKDASLLPKATLYTTLEPCTKEVRSKPLESCTELILQHEIRRVFIGILDPNQGVTGKGLWQLQDSGIEVNLFPHELAQQLRANNAAFIRSQQTLGASIIMPNDGDELRTYETGGKHIIRFKCLNPLTVDTYLFTYRNGLYWPQPGPFRHIDGRIWEVDAYFGTTGEHVLQLVTANDLGNVLIRYYRLIVEQNLLRRRKLRDKIDLSDLGDVYPGIQMNGLQKGLRLEASVRIIVAYKVNILAADAAPRTIKRGKTLKLTYEIESSENVAKGIWLGSSFEDKTGKLFYNTKEDKPVALAKGKASYNRNFTISKDAPLGEHMLRVNVWRGVVGDSTKSKWIGGRSTPITIVE